ncbi:MAG: hypothetical protein FJ027_05595 [Candidatus Rokubacteria bacterium]|nr:hypothetical protein [Candidatus Rokubacteria bacterium]
MRVLAALPLVLVALAVFGCAADEREWMKVNQRYTKEEFQRDYRECTRKGDLDEACMRQRGWQPMNPSTADAPPPAPSQPIRGRY